MVRGSHHPAGGHIRLRACLKPMHSKRRPGSKACRDPGAERRLTCHRNSRVRMKGVGCLNSHLTTVFHWLSRRGRSRWLLTHCTACPCWRARCTLCAGAGLTLSSVTCDCGREHLCCTQPGTAQLGQALPLDMAAHCVNKASRPAPRPGCRRSSLVTAPRPGSAPASAPHLCVVGVHDGFAGGPDGDGPLHLALP